MEISRDIWRSWREPVRSLWYVFMATRSPEALQRASTTVESVLSPSSLPIVKSSRLLQGMACGRLSGRRRGWHAMGSQDLRSTILKRSHRVCIISRTSALAIAQGGTGPSVRRARPYLVLHRHPLRHHTFAKTLLLTQKIFKELREALADRWGVESEATSVHGTSVLARAPDL